MPFELDGLVHRIEKLERENKRLKLVVMLAVVFVCALVLVGVAKPTRTIEAEQFILLDSHGRTKLTIGTPRHSGATVDANPNDAMIWIADDTGTDRVILMKDGLFFANDKGKPTVSLNSVQNSTSSLKLYGADGKVVFSAP
jgi:hypothetical protein